MKERLTIFLQSGAERLPELVRSRKATLLMVAAFMTAAFLSVIAAQLAARGIEYVVERDAQAVLSEQRIDWAELRTDGLLVYLDGEAPNEAERFRALSAVAKVVAAERVIDGVAVAPSTAISAPRFSMEILRNGLEVSLIGLIPTEFETGPVVSRIEAIDPEISVVNMLETASHAVPHGWGQAVSFGLDALALIPVSKVSIGADQVVVTGLAESERQRDDLREQLTRTRPRGLIASVSISAPRPVITPFTLRFVMDEDGSRFDACSADTSEARSAILNAGRAAGVTGVINCTIGLGTPTPRWEAGAVEAIRAVARLGAGSVTLSDSDISLVVPNSVLPDQFDQVVGELENRLPDIFSLNSTRLPPGDEDIARSEEVLEFVASRTPEGAVMLRGRLTDDRLRDAVQSLARAEFGLPAVQMTARVDPDLPEGWPVRALLAVDSLAQLEYGTVRVRPDRFEVTGVSGNASISDQMSRVLAEKLGQGSVFSMSIRYDEKYDPIANQPTPARCERWIAEVLEEQKITFEPGSASIVAGASRVVDQIAEILRGCGRLEMEVGGHTDSQGGLEGNMRLSQRRADAVKDALMARGALVSDFQTKGYGPEFPIADNATAAGRERNRRIEFKLIGASAVAAEAERASGQAVTEADIDASDSEPLDESGLEIAVIEGAGDAPRPPARPER
ncbi:MAG: OmpA family protein [Roseinatronobacter sp.]